MRRSKYFSEKRGGGGGDEATLTKPQVSTPATAIPADAHGPPQGSALASLAARKRKRQEASASTASTPLGAGEQQLTEMEKQVVALRQLHPDTLLLFECGYRMRIFADDAENAATVLGIRAQRHRAFVEASVPVHRTLFHARRLVHAGFKVGVVKQVDSVAMRAATLPPSAQRKPLERCVAEIYTRATIPAPDSDGNANAMVEEVGVQPRFIACVVETTVHSKPFFTQSMHDVGDDIKQSQAFAEDVRIGIFAHDVHSGESKFDEFEDGTARMGDTLALLLSQDCLQPCDGKRKRLQRMLQSLNPVELVLPAGKLSAYTEQNLKNFIATQGSIGLEGVSNDAPGLQCCIRVERLPNHYFDYSWAKETFTNVFRNAKDEYACLKNYPSLPRLSMCSFGGIWKYLSSLGLANSLIAPTYSSISNAAEAATTHFHLPAEAYRDLDLFVNSTTKSSRGSLFSILNHTKTDFGARRLQEWIRSPLGSLPAIIERQTTVQRLAFPSGALPRLSLPYRMAYEELTSTMLPRCKPLLRCLQQIHLGKATPSHVVGALQILQDLEGQFKDLKQIALAPGVDSQSQDRPELLERLLRGYPTLGDPVAQCLEEIDVKYAKRNDVEKTVLKRLYRQRSQARRHQDLVAKLDALDLQYESELEICRRTLNKPSLEFVTFRGGSLSDIHHLIQVPRAELHVVPRDWLVVNSTKKLVRFHPKTVVRLHVQEEFMRQQKMQLVNSAWRQFVRDVDAQVYVVGMSCVDTLATLDALCSLATVAQSYPNYSLPEFVDTTVYSENVVDIQGGGPPVLDIVDGRHPIIEALLDKSFYISNSLSLGQSDGEDYNSVDSEPCAGSLLVVSGPNMGGKSSLLRMCALVVLLAQMGSFVPATHVRLSVFDGIYTLMHRASTRLTHHTATSSTSCAQELTALSNISHSATPNSLVLLDEVGFGMAAREAEAVGIAQVRFLVERVGCHVLLASHLISAIHKLQIRLRQRCQTKQLEYHFDHVRVNGETQQRQVVTFHYALGDGVANDSFALDTARRAGLAPHLLERAQRLRDKL